MPASAADVIKPAFEHMKQQLFQPFRLGQWVKIALVGLLAGEITGGGGFGFQLPWRPRGTNRPDQFLAQAVPANAVLLAIGIALLVVIGIILVLVLLYVSSMMRFVLFDSVVNKACHVRRYWRQRRQQGFRFFLFQLLFAVTVLLAIGILIGAAAAVGFAFGWLKNPRQHLLPLILGGIIVFLLFAAIGIAAAVVAVLTKDFVVPQMALEDVSVGIGWSRLGSMLKAEKIGYLAYVGIKILLSILNTFVMGIIAIAVALVLLIPAGLIALIAVLVGKAIGLTWNAVTIAIAIVAGCLVLLALIFGVVVCSAPSVVFFPAYSIYFLAERYPALHRLIYPPPSPEPTTS
jgi:hypothetical protein